MWLGVEVGADEQVSCKQFFEISAGASKCAWLMMAACLLIKNKITLIQYMVLVSLVIEALRKSLRSIKHEKTMMQ